MMKLRWSTTVLAVLLWAGFAGTAFGQNTNSGDINGIVTDHTGAAIPGATVTVLNVETGVSKTYVTNDSGVYDTSSIVAGTYKLTFSKPGFSDSGSAHHYPHRRSYKSRRAALSRVGNARGRGQYRHTAPENRKRRAEHHAFRGRPAITSRSGAGLDQFSILLPGAAGAPGGAQGVIAAAGAPHQESRSQSMEICRSARYCQTGQRQPSPPALTLTSSPRRRSRNFSSAPQRSLRSTASAASCTTRSVREARTASTDRYMSIFRMRT